jgi:hypothetical protein
MSAADPISETAEQISSLHISEELRATISATTWVVRRDDERSYRLTRMDGYLIDAVVELSNVGAAEAAATMTTLSAKGRS